jgi:hypothetical protein
MYDDFFVCNWELESLLYEQSMLSRKLTALTPDEKQLFLMRSEKIGQLLHNMVIGKLANRAKRWLIPPANSAYLN